jgi:outer membrane protein TolC
VSAQRAIETAIERRPDIEQARLAIELREIQKQTTRAEYLPRLSAVANFNYTGRVPDDRELTLSDPNDPFAFSTQSRGFFDDDFWNPSVNVGLQLTWNIFNGFQTTARVEQQEVAVRRAEIDYQQAQQGVELEVRRALRNLEDARQRIQNQEQNVERAQTNYEFVSKRVQQGVSNQLELREASDQLDQSRLNYLQAMHDYLTAQSAFEAALGLPIAEPASDFQFTTR